MDAYIYIRIDPGKIAPVMSRLGTTQGVRNAVTVVGEWDVLALVEGPDLSHIANSVLTGIHVIDGVLQTNTALVVPADRVGLAGWGGASSPVPIPNVCFVHIKAEVGAAAGLVERMADFEDVSGVAVLSGDNDLLVCVAQPWEIASGVILEQIHALPGVRSTNTLVSVKFEEPDEDRDQFSTWS
ncbi:MAG: Lrp/AsnC ligand binding domain [Actinomycetota bacterium]|jgi:DNA-binding Lrp family transcriptional regulator|nr:Lrp/AsnC ligand binding domain [Actinomycetota bacterium]MEA2550647.1 Lrp/AsnC ligand binding domain [Actinomycetota bacterium]